MDINAGDVVKLKSGGPAMTVRWVEDGGAYCEWFDEKQKAGDRFAIISLKKAE